MKVNKVLLMYLNAHTELEMIQDLAGFVNNITNGLVKV